MAQSTQDPPRSDGEQPLGDGLAAPTQQVLELSVAERVAGEALIIDVDGFEGPLDLLLTLGRTQKVDLRHISILAWQSSIWNSSSVPRRCGSNWQPTTL